MVLAVAGVLLGTGLTWFLAPWQELRSARVVQADQSERARRGAPLRVQAAYAFVPEDGIVFAVPGRLDAGQVARITTPHTGSPEPIEKALPSDALRLAYPPIGYPGRTDTRMVTRVRVLLEGSREGSLLIKDIRARITKRTDPLSGTFVNGPPQGGEDVVHLGFDLDSPDLSARKTTEFGVPQGRFIGSKFITLQRGEQISLGVTAAAVQHYYEWVIDIVVWAGGRDEKMTVDDGGRPFRSTGLAARYAAEYEYQFPKGRFEEITPKTRRPR